MQKRKKITWGTQGDYQMSASVQGGKSISKPFSIQDTNHLAYKIPFNKQDTFVKHIIEPAIPIAKNTVNFTDDTQA